MGVTMKDIKELRSRTGAGVLDCKKALNEVDGDIEAAVEYLREKGMAAAAKKAGRVAAEGLVSLNITDDRKKGILVEVNSETDFVAKNDQFQNLVADISEHIMQSDAEAVEAVENEKWFKDESQTVNDVIKAAIASIGENINLRRFKKVETDGYLFGYIHLGGKIGVLVEFANEFDDSKAKTAKDVAMHIAAINPEFLDRDSVNAESIEKEKKIYREQMLNEGKPEHILDQIIEGKINKYFTQVCLLEQPFVRDDDKTVAEVLEENDMEVKQFTRFEIGEGIEKKEEDFAAEVAAVTKNQ
ncbi:MAG: elongation factor T [Halanaerobium sp. 4-GBenrich]|jgi:elongation factor Ts|uniref:Elongation factor Ts n=1 Tax=Halanaerobium congolense TaxID=54121 RepID=A0A1G6I629_9FIRM|nr:translation elongation factor Ts [Halanaerobium congolense]KXS50283.1 MAG: elongation factor T [Halanaerobium sp. T82-1]ODS50448.1 MAG: elongation factor T [Halanaerobium sp. 4-GBenrich]PUU91079.1 MAG: elongation factor T [Halanaerobium sp.]PTX17096.1 elongation factor Ts [Halanaerobium congolense]PXV69310.1 elongation factor Ts [Halanaerobium congolense]